MSDKRLYEVVGVYKVSLPVTVVIRATSKRGAHRIFRSYDTDRFEEEIVDEGIYPDQCIPYKAYERDER